MGINPQHIQCHAPWSCLLALRGVNCNSCLLPSRCAPFSVNIGCGPAEERVLLTGLHAVADIYCENCKTTLGWKYVSDRPNRFRVVGCNTFSNPRFLSRRVSCEDWHIWTISLFCALSYMFFSPQVLENSPHGNSPCLDTVQMKSLLLTWLLFLSHVYISTVSTILQGG